MPLAMLPPFVVPKNSTIHPIPLAEQQNSVANGVGRVIRVPNPRWWVRVLVRDVFGQYLLIIIIVVPFLLFFVVVEATTAGLQNQSKNALTSAKPRG